MQAVHDAHGDDDSENFLELLNSRTLAPELFAEPPACDYLKKMEYGASWAPPPDHQFTAAATNMEKHHQMDYINALAHQQQQQQQERGLTTANLSDLVSNWSIAPPSPCHGGGGGAKALFLDSGGNVKHEMGHGHGAGPGMLQQQEAAGGPGSSGQDFVRPVGGIGSYSPMLGLSSRMYGGSGDSMVDVQWAGPGSNGDRTTSLSDLISFGGAMGKPAPAAASPGKTSSSGEYKKMSSPVRVRKAFKNTHGQRRSSMDRSLMLACMCINSFTVYSSCYIICVRIGQDEQWRRGRQGEQCVVRRGEEEEIGGAAAGVRGEREEVQAAAAGSLLAHLVPQSGMCIYMAGVAQFACKHLN